MGNDDRALRIISIYERLVKGELLNRKELARQFNVSTRTITRNIKDLNIYLDDINGFNGEDLIKYSRRDGGYRLKHDENSWLTSREILGLAKVLLESRAFNEQEMKQLIDKLVINSSPGARKHIKDMLSNERFYYTPVQHNRPLLGIIWELSRAINHKYVVEISYNKPGKADLIERKIEPLAIMFSEYYFYLIAHSYQSDEDYNIVYRIDRIIDYNITDQHFQLRYRDRFEEGKFRKRVQFMMAGHLLKVKFKYTGNLEAALDRLPTAKVIGQDNGSYLIEAEVYGPGIKMWLLSQGQYVEVLEPGSLREEMKETVGKMMEKYR